MFEPTVALEQLIKHRFALMPEWRMSDIMDQGDALAEVLVELQPTRR